MKSDTERLLQASLDLLERDRIIVDLLAKIAERDALIVKQREQYRLAHARLSIANIKLLRARSDAAEAVPALLRRQGS